MIVSKLVFLVFSECVSSSKRSEVRDSPCSLGNSPLSLSLSLSVSLSLSLVYREAEGGAESGGVAWRALGQLLSYPPELLVTAIGQDRYRGGVVTLFECLQCHTLNKQVCSLSLSVNHLSLSVCTYVTPSLSLTVPPAPLSLQLLFTLLDIIVLELFPELSGNQQNSDDSHGN